MTVISVNDLYKSYGDVTALRGITFDVNEGSIVGFLGPNGAGKTTTIGILFQFIYQDRGDVKIFNKDVTKNISKIKQDIGLIPDTGLPSIRGIELLRHTGQLYGIRGQQLDNRINEVVKTVAGSSFYRRNTKAMSNGQKQRIKIANALIHEPTLIIADEPTAGLDPISRRQLLSLFLDLKDKGKTIFFSNHVISEVEKICDDLIIISQGEIKTKGKIDDIRNTLPMTNKYLLTATGIGKNELLQLDGVEDVKVQYSSKFLISVKDDEDKNPAFLRQLLDKNVKIRDFSTQALELEDIFLEVTE